MSKNLLEINYCDVRQRSNGPKIICGNTFVCIFGPSGQRLSLRHRQPKSPIRVPYIETLWSSPSRSRVTNPAATQAISDWVSQSNAPEYSIDNGQSLIFPRDSRASETQEPVKIIPREKGETPRINRVFFTWVLGWNVPVRPLLYMLQVKFDFRLIFIYLT